MSAGRRRPPDPAKKAEKIAEAYIGSQARFCIETRLDMDATLKLLKYKRDALDADIPDDLIREVAEDAATKVRELERRGDDRVPIDASEDDLQKTTALVWEQVRLANEADPRLFTRGGVPVRLVGS